MSQTQVHLLNKDINTISGQTLVVFAKANADKTKAAKISHVETAKALQVSLEEKLITGAASEVISFREARFLGYRNVVSLGLGADNYPLHRQTDFWLKPLLGLCFLAYLLQRMVAATRSLPCWTSVKSAPDRTHIVHYVAVRAANLTSNDL